MLDALKRPVPRVCGEWQCWRLASCARHSASQCLLPCSAVPCSTRQYKRSTALHCCCCCCWWCWCWCWCCAGGGAGGGGGAAGCRWSGEEWPKPRRRPPATPPPVAHHHNEQQQAPHGLAVNSATGYHELPACHSAVPLRRPGAAVAPCKVFRLRYRAVGMATYNTCTLASCMPCVGLPYGLTVDSAACCQPATLPKFNMVAACRCSTLSPRRGSRRTQLRSLAIGVFTMHGPGRSRSRTRAEQNVPPPASLFRSLAPARSGIRRLVHSSREGLCPVRRIGQPALLPAACLDVLDGSINVRLGAHWRARALGRVHDVLSPLHEAVHPIRRGNVPHRADGHCERWGNERKNMILVCMCGGVLVCKLGTARPGVQQERTRHVNGELEPFQGRALGHDHCGEHGVKCADGLEVSAVPGPTTRELSQDSRPLSPPHRISHGRRGDARRANRAFALRREPAGAPAGSPARTSGRASSSRTLYLSLLESSLSLVPDSFPAFSSMFRVSPLPRPACHSPDTSGSVRVPLVAAPVPVAGVVSRDNTDRWECRWSGSDRRLARYAYRSHSVKPPRTNETVAARAHTRAHTHAHTHTHTNRDSTPRQTSHSAVAWLALLGRSTWPRRDVSCCRLQLRRPSRWSTCPPHQRAPAQPARRVEPHQQDQQQQQQQEEEEEAPSCRTHYSSETR